MQNVITNYNLFIHKIADTNSVFIQFNILEKSYIILKILNEDDKQVRVLLNETLQQGSHQIPFYYSTLAAGKYIVRLIVDNEMNIDIENKSFTV
jgi:hypothetical protein